MSPEPNAIETWLRQQEHLQTGVFVVLDVYHYEDRCPVVAFMLEEDADRFVSENESVGDGFEIVVVPLITLRVSPEEVESTP